jgi:hypothetical protein
MLARLRIFCLVLFVLPGLLSAQYVRRGTRSVGPNNGVPAQIVPPVEMRGKLRDIDKKKIVIDCGEDQILTFKRSKKTRFLKGEKVIQPDEFTDGAKVTIEASRALNGDYDAVNVYLGEPPSSDKPAPSDSAKQPTSADSSSH